MVPKQKPTGPEEIHHRDYFRRKVNDDKQRGYQPMPSSPEPTIPTSGTSVHKPKP